MSGTVSKGREKYCRQQLAALADIDPAAQAAALGLGLDPEGRVEMELFGRKYLADKNGVEPVDGAPCSPDHQSILAHYLRSAGRGELEGEFVPIGRLTGQVATEASPSYSLLKPLEEKFGEKYDLFAKAAAEIGGRHEGLTPAGAQCWMFRSLPKLPVQVAFFEADDEFPAEVKVFFDKSAARFMSYECLEIVEIALVLDLLRAGGFLAEGEDYSHHFF